MKNCSKSWLISRSLGKESPPPPCQLSLQLYHFNKILALPSQVSMVCPHSGGEDGDQCPQLRSLSGQEHS